MKNIADVLNQKIRDMKSPIVVGLDPVLKQIPNCYKEKYINEEDRRKAIGNILFDFNKDIIDAVYDIVPCVKPQIAFYEMYGASGIEAFEKTIKYAKSKGMITIADAKRNDVGNTAQAYAKTFLGKVDIGNGQEVETLNADFLTVSPFIGADGLEPFVKECVQNNKGMFLLVKTSNPLSGFIQDVVDEKGEEINAMVAKYVAGEADKFLGESGYSPMGAVVMTTPERTKRLRKIMAKSIFLVPGYGA
ncbi:MAG: orotidine-5'-phosphate decarboxylase, partial [Oscillospiraceae bacterium]|nr:orotidine-5'-phosphate decarboxylase [Oscillospiraceae bacterium]